MGDENTIVINADPTPVPVVPVTPVEPPFTPALIQSELQAVTGLLHAVQKVIPSGSSTFSGIVAFIDGLAAQPWMVDMLVTVLNKLAPTSNPTPEQVGAAFHSVYRDLAHD